MPSNEDLRKWFSDAPSGATHIVMETDTFPHKPVTSHWYIMGGEQVPEAGYFPGAMRGVTVYDLARPVEHYLASDHAPGCPVVPCGCG